MITVKVNIDFSKALKKIEGDEILKLSNEGVISPIAKASSDFIRAGKVSPPLSEFNPRGENAPPLFDTGKLANSLKGTTKGISGESYGIEHRKTGGYTWEEKKIKVRKREFIISSKGSEQGTVDKIYKEFQDKFVKLIDKSIRK